MNTTQDILSETQQPVLQEDPEQYAISSGFDGIGELLPAPSMTGNNKLLPQESPAFVLEPDDRVRVGDTTSFPFSAVGRMRVHWSNGDTTTCSGAMISPYHFLTAGHCVYSEDRGGWADRIEVMVGSKGDIISGSSPRRADYEYYGEANSVNMRSYNGWTEDADRDYDMGLITLDRNIGNHTGWFGYGFDNNLSSGTLVNVAGYPSDLFDSDGNDRWDNYDMVRQSGDITSTQTLTLRSTELDIISGNSGGPLWIYRTDPEERIIYGVTTSEHWNGDKENPINPYNQFSRITSDRFSDLENWISEDDDIRPPTDRPDLVDYDDWFDTSFASFSDSEVEVGDNLRLRTVVRNNGTATAGEFTVSFYASTDTTINSSGDRRIGSTTISALEPFTWADAIWEGDLPDIPAGEYYIGWEIDSFNSVVEFDEDNTGIITSDRLEVLDSVIIAPANDNFNQASLISGTPGSFTFNGTNIGATKEGSEPNHAGNSGGSSVWWNFTPQTSGEATLTTVGSDFDTTLAVYTGTSIFSLSEVASNDDFEGLQSSVEFSVTAGTTYRIAVDGFSGRQGNIELNLEYETVATGPANDSFNQAFDLTGSTAFGTNINATGELGEPNHVGRSDGNSVWWNYTARGSGEVTLTTTGSDFDTLLAVYTGNSVSSLTEIASNDDDPDLGGRQSRVTFNATAGTTYRIAVDGYRGAQGEIVLNLTEPENIFTGPANDNFNQAFDLTGTGTVDGTNIGATKEGSEPNHAGNSGGGSVWWNYTPETSGEVTLITAGSDFDTLLAVYTGNSVSSLTEIASNDDDPTISDPDDPSSRTSRVTFDATAGTTYRIAVDGYSGAQGDIFLDLQRSIIEDEEPSQIVYPDLLIPPASPNSPVGINVNYRTSDNNPNLTALELRLHYDSSQINFSEFNSLLPVGSIGNVGTPEPDNQDFDSDFTTDTFVTVSWASLEKNFPGQIPALLYTANFTTTPDFAGTTINFTRVSKIPGYEFEATPVNIPLSTSSPTPSSASLDVDGNGVAQGPTDGFLIARYLFGRRGDELIDGVVDPNGTRIAANEIEAYLEQNELNLLDVDGNGVAQGPTDGFLIARYLFGRRGDELIDGVVDPNGTRTTVTAIENFLQSLMPGQSNLQSLIAEQDGQSAFTSLSVSPLNDELPAQIITPVPETQIADNPISFTLNYDTSDGSTNADSLSLRLHYNAAQLAFTSFDEQVDFGLFGGPSGEGPQPETPQIDDNDPSTDTFMEISWANFGTPFTDTVPVDLGVANFTAQPDFTGTASINFTRAINPNFNFDSTPAVISSDSTSATGVTIAESGGSTNITEGGAADDYMVVLDAQPTADVIISIASDDQSTTAPTSVTFTPDNWNAPQTVTVTAVDDSGVEGTHASTISHTASSADSNYNAIQIANVIASITDNDSDSPPDAINLDIDGNGETDALTDGVAAMRYLFQFRGDVLIDNVIGVGATRTTALEITNYLDMAGSTMLDVDGNGMADALTDGIMIMRYLFGFGGNAVIDGALGPDATRTTAAAIIDHLQSFDIGF